MDLPPPKDVNLTKLREIKDLLDEEITNREKSIDKIVEMVRQSVFGSPNRLDSFIKKNLIQLLTLTRKKDLDLILEHLPKFKGKLEKVFIDQIFYWDGNVDFFLPKLLKLKELEEQKK